PVEGLICMIPKTEMDSALVWEYWLQSELEVGELLELPIAAANVVGRQPPQPITAELLNVEGSHHRSIGHGATQRSIIDFIGLGEITHESTSEAVAGTGRIENTLERESGDRKEGITRKEGRSILASLDDEHLWSELENLFGCADQIGFAGYLASFS